MEPTQDFINEDIIKHILQTGSVETLNITFSSDKLPVTRNAMMNIIKQDDNLCKALIKKYCDITSYTLSWAKQQKPLLNLWRNTSNEIYNLLMKDIPGEDDHGFIPDDHEPTTDTILHSYVLYTQKPLPKKYHKHEANLKKISKIFS